MKKIIPLIVLSFLFFTNTFSQTISTSKIALKGIDFPLSIAGLPDTLKILKVKTESKNFFKEYSFKVVKGKVDTSIAFNKTGNFKISLEQFTKMETELRVLPGYLSIVPPLLAILLALIFRQVIVSLMLGIYIGAVFIFNYNPLTGLLRLADTYIINTLLDPSHIKIIVFTLLFGGVIGLISKSGGTKGIANLVTRYAKTRKSGQIATWLSGVLIFFDDYANSLIVGNLMRPITDKLKVSREKLSFIVDATSAPVASIFIVSSWIGFEVGLINDGLNIIHSSENAYGIFLQTIPYRFYPIAMLLFVFLVGYLQRDFGPMLKAERRAVDEGKVMRDDAVAAKDLTDTSEIFGNEDKAKWYNGVIPIFILVFGTIAGLAYTGLSAVHEQGLTNYGIREIIGNSDSYVSLLWASFSACIAAGILILSQKIMTLNETVDAWFLGIRSMLLAAVILTLAWSIGSITQDIKTADYVVSMISDTINPRFLPVIVFLVCALISFSTGTSWGTMAIMMPIVIPLSHHVTNLFNYDAANHIIILHGVISSVLAGSVFGDHCSPISDTTILSSMASGCNHIDHVRTQLPYAVVVALLCMIIGDVPTAFGLSPYISIAVIAILLVAILFLFGKKVSSSENKIIISN